MIRFEYGPLFEAAEDGALEGKEGVDTGSEDNEESPVEGDEEEDSDALTEDDEKEAKALFKLLKNKGTQVDVIRVLAHKAGLLDPQAPPQNKTEEKKAKQGLREILKEGLGPEYDNLLGDRLEKVLSKVLEQERESLKELEAVQVENKVDAAFDKLAAETKGESNKYKARMNQLVDELQMAPGTSVEKYIRNLYRIASSEGKANNTGKQIADRINRNANNAADRLNSSSSSHSGGNKDMKNPPKGLKNIVAAALQSIEPGASTGKK